MLGSLSEPVYRSHNLRVAYEDACHICADEQEKAGLDILCDGAQYYEWEAPGFQLEPIFHFIPENLGGFRPYGPPGEGAKYRPFYQAVVKDKITWERPIFESVVMTMQNVTDKPFKVAFLGPAQQSVIVKDEFYGDQVAVARDLAIAMNKELKYLVSIGLEAVQLIDVLPPYTTDMWQIEMQNIMFDGVDAIKFWHVCYGSVDGQRDIFDNHAAVDDAAVQGVAGRRDPPGVHQQGLRRAGGVPRLPHRQGARRRAWWTRRTCRWRRPSRSRPGSGARLEVVPADRLLVAPDCGLGYFSRTAAYAKLRNMGQAAATCGARSDGAHGLTEATRDDSRSCDAVTSAPGGSCRPGPTPGEARMTAEVAREVLGLQLRVGDHICGFYRKPAERDDILIPFLVEGLKAGDKCTCVVDSCTPEDVLASMSEHLEVDPYVTDRQLEVLDSYGTYLADGGFLPERMLKFWEAKARQNPGGEPGRSPVPPGTSAT